ncbi:MAG: hypothetical protein K0R59_184 [Sphingobacterium sp.]|nr:hypothetical protein [Sphingobacterium sp.]
MGLVVLSTSCSLFKKKNIPPPATTATKPAETPKKGPKPYKEVITDKAKTSKGLFKVHFLDDRYFLEIPDSLLGREMLLSNRIHTAPADANNVYGNDEISSAVVSFDKANYNKLYIKQRSFNIRSNDTTMNGMSRSIHNSNFQPLVGAFDIKTVYKDSTTGFRATVIDVTDYLNADDNIFTSRLKKILNDGSYASDRSYIDTIKTYQKNVEFTLLRTYTKSGSPTSLELNSSLVLLPKDPMRPRYSDTRVGYFTNEYTDFDGNPNGIKPISMITRWRLEPKPEDIPRYLKGELVEPKKPIIFYIDPATPKKWVPYLIQGVNDWQVAFEQAGFKNAILAKEAPSDSTWSLDNALNSAIVYKASEIANASGPHISDPRTGEILESHVNWYHNVMDLLKSWYFTQAAAIDPNARKPELDEALMGQLIRFVSSHEIGHTLGLRHNFGSSSTVPVEKLRDKQWVEAHGHTPSIMDYARFNYVAQPEDHIGQSGIFPRIGDYDKWAIEWGYRWWPQFKNRKEEDAFSNKLIIDSLQNKRLYFGTELDKFDPRNQSEDLGDNAMLASMYGIKNLKRILPNIINWSRVPDEGYAQALQNYQEVVGQFSRYLGHVCKNVGGIYTTPKAVEQVGNVYEPVPKAIQKEAVAFLNTQLFDTPTWLVNKELMEKAGADPLENISAIQKRQLDRLLNGKIISRLIKNEALHGKETYTAQNLFDDLNAGIMSELHNHKKIEILRRSLQELYVNDMIDLLNGVSKPIGNDMMFLLFGSSKSDGSDVVSMARVNLSQLARDIRKGASGASGISRAHLENLLVKINRALEGKTPPTVKSIGLFD